MMTKNGLFAVALVSVALWVGCATGGGGHSQGVQVSVGTNPPNQSVVGVTLTVQFTATVTGTDNKAVTWSLKQNGTACTGNTCGTISASGLYAAPATPPSPDTVAVTATSQADSTKSGSLNLKVLPITVTVTPGPATVGVNFQQQFTATAAPDAEPQTFQWSIPAADCPANDCGSVDSTGLYTAPSKLPSEKSFSVQAASTVDPNTWIAKSKVTVVTSRIPAGTYAFRFSGFNIAGPIAVVGSFVSSGDGTIASGVEDEFTTAGPVHRTIGASSYTLDSNSHGTITLNPSGGVSANTYDIVLDASGDIQAIESTSDGTNRHASGVIELAATSKFKDNTSLLGSFVFGFTGADLSGKRVGYAGLLPLDGIGGISGGLLDINDNGGGTNGTPTAVTGSYNIANGVGTMTLTAGAATFHFAIYGVSGAANASNPLTLYAISTTDPIATNPGVAGTILFQDRTPQYVNADFGASTISNLTGVDTATGTDTLVSLTAAAGDGNGHLSGAYDANNAGTIVAAKSFSNYAYSASPSGTGRYTVDLLGDPAANPVVPPVHFVLYCGSASKKAPRGFLLDQSSQAVMTGTMDPQTGSFFAASEVPGSYAAATTNSGTSSVSQVAANLLLTSPGNQKFNVTGTQDVTGDPNPESVSGTYSVNLDGTGKITLTAPSASNFVIYLLDTSHFMMMNVDNTNKNSSIAFAQQ